MTVCGEFSYLSTWLDLVVCLHLMPRHMRVQQQLSMIALLSLDKVRLFLCPAAHARLFC